MRSRRQVAVLPRCLGLTAFAGLTLLSIGLINPVWAAKSGHGSVMSPAGAPRQIPAAPVGRRRGSPEL